MNENCFLYIAYVVKVQFSVTLISIHLCLSIRLTNIETLQVKICSGCQLK